MSKDLAFLRDSAGEIAAATAAYADIEAEDPALLQLIEQVSNPSRPLDPGSLGDLEAAPFSRVLRAFLAACIEVIHRAAPRNAARELVPLLRERVDGIRPPAAVDPQQMRFYRALMDRRLVDSPDPTLLCLFGVVLSTMRDIVMLHDPMGNLLYMNHCGLALTKYTKEDIVSGLSLLDLVSPAYFDVLEDRMESLGTISRSPYTIEIYAKDGERIPVDISSLLSCGEGKDPSTIVSVVRDLRLERRLEDQIRQLNARLEHLAANAPIAILITDSSAIIREANPIAVVLCGAPVSNSLIGMPVYELADDEGVLSQQSLSAILKDQSSVRERVHLHTCFGASLKCDLSISVFTHAHRAAGLLLILSDISKELALREDLIQAERLSALGGIVAGAAHELNNPLAGIMGSAQYLLSTELPAKTRARLEQMAMEAQRAAHIVHNLLAFADHQDLEKAERNANKLVEEAMALCEYQLRMDDIDLVLDLEPELPSVNVSSLGLIRVFISIVDNAHKALVAVSSHENRRLTVCTRCVEKEIRIRFEDNGCGMPKDVLPHIFDPFFTTADVGRGTGLGLSIAYGIIDEHGGRIRAESEEGRGTTIEISLPVRAH